MPITINVSMVDAGASQPVTNTTLHESRITIGRDQECTLALEDPKKHVSRVHAELEEKDGAYWMKVVSKVNPVFINKRRHDFGERVALTTGDILSVGTYQLAILIPVEEEAEAADATMLSSGSTATFIAAPELDIKQAAVTEQTYIPPPAQPVIPVQITEADLSDELTFVRRPEKKETVPKPADKPAPIPEADLSDELTFVRRPEKKVAPPQPAAKPVPVPEEDLSGELTFVRRPEKKETVPKPAPVAEEDLSGELTFVRRPTIEATNPQGKAAPAQRMETDVSEALTYVRPLASSPQPTSATNTALGADAGAQRALQAFFQGAGLGSMEVADAEAFLRDSGMIVRAAVEGIMLLLAARNSALKELGVTLPPVSAGAHVNNPLKSMSDPHEVIAFLFDPHQRTSAAHDPVQAFGDACVDLRAHEMALLTSLRAAALKAVLSVDPLEFDRDHGKNLGTFGMNRKSKLWDLFVAHHNQLAHGSRDGFKSKFGHDLTSAYVAHIRRLRGGH